MNKIILIFTTLLFSTGAFASGPGCNNLSLKGRFSYEVSGNNYFPLPGTGQSVTRSTHVIGKVQLDGSEDADGFGIASFKGFGSAAGALESKTGSGKYKVNPDDCTVEGTLIWNDSNGNPTNPPELLTSTFRIILDNMGNSGKFYKAFHGNVVATDNVLGHPEWAGSASGSITRLMSAK